MLRIQFTKGAKSRLTRTVFVLLAASAVGRAQTINVDINKGTSPNYSGTAVAPDAGTFWNSLISPAASTITLTNVKNSANVATNVDITITRSNGSNFLVWDDATAATGNPNPVPLMREYLYGGPYQVTIASLTPSAYTLYVFAHGNAASQNSTISLATANGGASGTTGTTGTEWRNLFTPGADGYSFLKLSGITDGSGTLTFTTTVNLNGFQLIPTPPPVIVTQPPANLTAYRGSDVSIGVTATSSAPASYRWRKSTDGETSFLDMDTRANPSAVTAKLDLSGVRFSDAGIYQVIASSAAGSVTSGTCTLHVEENPAPLFSIHPAPQIVLTGEQVIFTAAASAPTGVVYQWLKNGNQISGKTGASLTIQSAQLGDSGSYSVLATNNFGVAASNPAILEVVESLPIPAFPGAEGPGSTASGGRGGEVYHVTNLSDDRVTPPPGSLRYGLTQNVPPGGRTIVFDVGGTIRLLSSQLNDASSNIWLRSGADNITIAGQTAPYPGITIINHGTKITGNNVILRNLAFRPGADRKNPGSSTNDGLSLQTKNSIIDHVSCGFIDDEGLSPTDAVYNTTVQYSIIAEGLNYVKQDGKQHAFGTLLSSEVANSPLSLHHNLYSDMTTRNPRIGNDGNGVVLGGSNEGSINNISNNVIYNWNSRASYDAGATRPARANFLNNYFIAGPSNISTDRVYFGSGTNVRIHHSGNMVDMNKNGAVDGIAFNFSGPQFEGSVAPMPTPFAIPSGHLQSAADAVKTVLDHAGTFWWNRTPLEARIIHEVQTGGGTIIKTGTQVASISGYEYPATTGGPTYTEPGGTTLQLFDGLPLFPIVSRPPGFDTDLDGIPNEWETRRGLNPTLADNHGDFDSDGYTNLEEYLNEIAAFPAPTELNFSGAGGRYAHWKNWNLYWQPSRYDQVLIKSANAIVDSPGQHAGTITVRGSAMTPELHISDGWLEVEKTCTIGGEGETGRLRLTGGKLIATKGLTIAIGGEFEVNGNGLVVANLNNEFGGTMHVTGGTLSVSGDLTNHGTLRVVNRAALEVEGNFTNRGLLDIMTGAQNLPKSFVNHGTVLDSSHIRVTAVRKSGNSFSVTIKGYSGHSYQLMRTQSLDAPWVAEGQPQLGENAPLIFTDTKASDSRCFYRIAVSP